MYKAFMYILLKNLNITSVGTIKKHHIGLGHYFGSITLDINQVFLHMFDINQFRKSRFFSKEENSSLEIYIVQTFCFCLFLIVLVVLSQLKTDDSGNSFYTSIYIWRQKRKGRTFYLRKKFFIGKLIHAKSYPITQHCYSKP